MRRVVITGLGIYSCLGKNAEEVTQSLKDGKSGIVREDERLEMGFASALSGKIDRPNLKEDLHRRSRNQLSEEAEYAFVATKQALQQAGMDEEFLLNSEVGILYGNDSSSDAVIKAIDTIREKKDSSLIGSGSIFQSMNSTVTMNLATIFKLKGINFTVSGACASGSHSIGMGYFLIRHGMQDQMVCGGAQEVNKHAMVSFDALGAFSTRNDEPQKASRPFDKNRDGLVPSGGAATIIIESLESAQNRGAKILGEVVGYGFSSNGDHISQPNVDGPVRSLQRSLEDAKLSSTEIDYINAHATSTPLGDESEAKSISKVFSQSNPIVTSTKSMTGHECWMAGASEVVYSMFMMQNSFVAPNINLEEPDEFSSLLNIPNTCINKNIDLFLSNSFGFGGTNSSLIIKKFEE